MALWNEHGFNTARYSNIINAATGVIPVANVTPMDDEEKGVFDWAKDIYTKAKREGRKIMFDIPFDPDDRYDGIYSKSADDLAKEVDRKG